MPGNERSSGGLAASLRTGQHPDVLSDYEVLEKIAESPLGRVDRARNAVDGGEVALKWVADPQVAAREVEALTLLQHPKVVRLLEHGETAHGSWLALEWLDGGMLEQAAPLSLLEWQRLAVDALEALQAVHQAGLLHLDVKPANFMKVAGGCGGWKLIDFGECGPMAQASERAMTGSIHCMAPERFGRPELDGRTDVYSLGCTLAFALAGRFVHEGETVPQVITSHLHPPDWDQQAVFAELPDAWRTWLRSLLSVDRDRRPDAASALEALKSCGAVTS